jgi:SAM-dependent methyltransferase
MDSFEEFFGEAAWEARYSASESGIWSGNPNPVLVAELSELPPGSALDVGCGEGADALWLAARGWRVTGTDISTVALERAAAHGKLQGADVDWQHVDLLATPPLPGRYDLVTAHFMQLPTAQRRSLYGHLAAAVAKGGTLLLVGHHPSGMPTGTGHAHLPDMVFTAEELAAELDPQSWEIQVVDTRPRQGRDPEGREISTCDAVMKARRVGG